MKRRTLNILLVIFILTFVYTIMAYLDIMVSLKYEIDSSNECISTITGYDLCRLQQIYKIAMGLACMLVIVTIILKSTVQVKGKTEAKAN
jgi:amino acid transporter